MCLVLCPSCGFPGERGDWNFLWRSASGYQCLHRAQAAVFILPLCQTAMRLGELLLLCSGALPGEGLAFPLHVAPKTHNAGCCMQDFFPAASPGSLARSLLSQGENSTCSFSTILLHPWAILSSKETDLCSGQLRIGNSVAKMLIEMECQAMPKKISLFFCLWVLEPWILVL